MTRDREKKKRDTFIRTKDHQFSYYIYNGWNALCAMHTRGTYTNRTRININTFFFSRKRERKNNAVSDSISTHISYGMTKKVIFMN